MTADSARSILIRGPGGPDVLEPIEIELPPLAPGQIRIRQAAIGVNYHDVYVRSGLYQTLALPGVPGIEAVGRVEAIGPDVTGFTMGERIGYISSVYGAYADVRNLDATLAVRLPESYSDPQWAATLMKAMTVCMLVRHVHRVRAGEFVLVHAAAGGVGQLLCSWARYLGARIIATVGSKAKAATAQRAGAEHVILYRSEDVAARVAEITNGDGVSVAYDSVGADTFQGTLDSLGYEGHLVNYGQASGPVPPFSPGTLSVRSLTLSRPIIFHYLRTAAKLERIAQETLDALDRGVIVPLDPMVLALNEAAQAHRHLEARRSPGGIVLQP